MQGEDGLVYFGADEEQLLSIDQFGVLQSGAKLSLRNRGGFRVDRNGNAVVLRYRVDPGINQTSKMWVEFYTNAKDLAWEYELNPDPVEKGVYLPKLGKNGDFYVVYDNFLLIFSPGELLHN